MSDTLDTIQGPSSWLSRFLLPQPQPAPQPQAAPAPGLKVTVDRTPAPVGPITPGVAAIPKQARAPAPAAAAPAAPHPSEDPRIQQELQDPETKKLLAETMIGEGSTPQMQQAIMETILNRARMSGQSIKEVIEERGQFTSMDYGVPGSHRQSLDAEVAADDPRIEAAMSLVDNPRPGWRIAPNITHFYDTRTQAAMRAKNPSIYPERPGFAQGNPALTIGTTQFYPGGFPTGRQQQAPTGQAQDAGTITGLDPQMTAIARQDIAMEQKLLPSELKALEQKQAFNEQIADKLMGYMDKNNEITDRLMKSNQSLIDSMPDEKKMRQEELAKVSDQPMDPTRVLGQLLPMIAILGGAFTKAGVTGSLNAAAAAMNAAKGNDDAAIKRASDAFHDQLQETMDKWSMVHQAMTDAYTNNKDNMTDYMSAMQLVAARYDIPGLQHALISGDLKDIMGFADNGLKAGLQLQKFQLDALKMENDRVKLDMQIQSAQAGASLSDGDLAEQAFMARKDSSYRPQFSFNKETQDRYAHISAMVFRHPNADTWDEVRKDEGLPGGSESGTASASADVAGRAETEAGKKALTWATDTKTQIEQFEGTAQKNAKLVVEQAAKGVAGEYPAINKWIQAGRRATGDPDVYTFNTSIRTFASEYARVMTTGGTGAGGRTTNWAQQEIDHLLNPNMNAQDIAKTIGIMQREMDNRMSAIDETIAHAQERLKTGKEPASKPSAEGAPAAHAKDPLGLGL